jgi:uncharacterized RDD family membrane protein YckC
MAALEYLELKNVAPWTARQKPRHSEITPTMADFHPPIYAPLWRRLAAALYDGLLLLALLMTALLIEIIVRDAFGLPRSETLLRAMPLLVALGFYGAFWTRGGQTLGMRAWRLRLQRADGRAVRWSDAMLRVAVGTLSWGLLGLGVLWCLVDARRRAWHDLATGTELLLVPRPVSVSRGS